MCRLADGRVIAPTPEERRIVVRAVLEKAQNHGLLAFNLADTHLHLEVAEDAKTSAELTRRIEISITKRLALRVGFARAHSRVIEDQRHLFNAFDYIMRQTGRHGLTAWDPFCEASNLPDLLGLRVLGRYTARNVRQRLPRVDRALLLTYLEVEQLEPQSEPLELIVPAALAAAGLLDLQDRDGAALEARRAIVEVIGDRWPSTRIAALLGVSPRTIQRMRAAPVDEALASAIRLQLGLRCLKRELQDPSFTLLRHSGG